ncbi:MULTISPECIES: glycoside hydrolase family 95 protein [Niastella]|uniref:Glycoside hydrolase family 95 protein n=1 Tax=Niastella soli TaxID=2821487 RepID=A0ABS3YXH0_9BACT|nr:glycoside hydrolase family 95 protein [Niastella soli]MBO9202120.1 glycoside hydrolase family 95 protein [Niastella soli]
MKKYTRRSVIQSGTLAALSFSPLLNSLNKAFGSPAPFKAAGPSSDLLLWYRKPAEKWLEALPVGNGKLGGMVFGGAAQERISVSEDTLWTGGPYQPGVDVSPETLDNIKKLSFQGKFAEAQELVKQLQGKPHRQAAYQTVGEVQLNFPDIAEPSDYHRELDLNTGIVTITFTANDVQYKRETFASYPNHVIVTHITASKPGQINLQCNFTTLHRDTKLVTTGNNALIMDGKNGDLVVENDITIPAALTWQCRVAFQASGGKQTAVDNTIQVTGANEVTIYTTAATSYISYNNVSGKPTELCAAVINKCLAQPYNTLRAKHVADYQQLFNKVQLSLTNQPPANLPTNERIKNFATGNDPSLATLYFQYGRYLLLSSSRPGSQPANLQGRWNDSLSASWGGKYTVNINTEMNYWPAQKTNLASCELPLLQLVKDIAITGQVTAKKTYHARGWVCHHNTDLWRATAPIDSAFYGQWPTGGAWLCNHLYQHYLYSGDTAYLQELYPLMKGAAEFFMDTMVRRPVDFWLVTVPSMSPENGRAKGVSSSPGPTMDMQILRELFTHCASAAAILKKDMEFQQGCKETVLMLAPAQIGKGGQLQEWLDDVDMESDKYEHRHMSPLYGLFPGYEITPDKTALFAAAYKLTEMRGFFGEGMGWALAWRLNLWARLQHADNCFKLVNTLISTKTEQNLFDKPHIQLDGNFGGTSGITEMLLQSHAGSVHLLPALPTQWNEGALSGLCTQGGFEIVHLAWKNGNITALKIRSKLGGNLRLQVPNEVATPALPAIKPASGINPNPFFALIEMPAPLIVPNAPLKQLELKKNWLYDLPTQKGQVYEIKFK